MITIEIPNEVLGNCCQQINELRRNELRRSARPWATADLQRITSLDREASDIRADLAAILIGLLVRAGLMEPLVTCESL